MAGSLPDGHTRATTTEPGAQPPRPRPTPPAEAADALSALLTQHAGAGVTVAHRPLSFYDTVAGITQVEVTR